MMPNIDRSQHNHGLHNVEDRFIDAQLNGHSDTTPHNDRDLACVHEAEFNPHIVDGSLDGDVTRGLDYQAKEGGVNMWGRESYNWDGEDLARRICRSRDTVTHIGPGPLAK